MTYGYREVIGTQAIKDNMPHAIDKIKARKDAEDLEMVNKAIEKLKKRRKELCL